MSGPFLNCTFQTKKQIVVVDGVQSHTEVINAGIPQGSRLGPLISIMYIKDIKGYLETKIIIFAAGIAFGPNILHSDMWRS